MSTTQDGGPAFPKALDPYPNVQDVANAAKVPQSGMSMRDWFAGHALVGIISTQRGLQEADTLAGYAYQMADAMLKARQP